MPLVIPACPPVVPNENPTGTYRRTVRVPSTWDNTWQLRLRFDGVDSAYHVRVNDNLVGTIKGPETLPSLTSQPSCQIETLPSRCR